MVNGMSRTRPLLARTAIRAFGVGTMIIASIACTSPVADVTGAPSGSADPSVSAPSNEAPTMTSAPRNEPSATPRMFSGFQYADNLRVEVDGLAVREAPSVTAPLAQGYRADEGTVEPTGDVRLDAGYFVSVHLGPLRNGDTVWYLVWPAVDARLNYNPGTWWDSNGDFSTVGGVDPGWVAGSVGDDQFLSLHRQPGRDEIGEGVEMLSGTGDFESEQLPRYDLWGFNWAVAVDDGASPCAFSVTLVPEDGAAAGPVAAVQTSTTDVEQGPVTGPGSQIDLPWGPSTGGSWDSFTISIKSGCTWSVGLRLAGHD